MPKQLLFIFTALFVSSFATAGFPPKTECINVGNTIQMRRDIFSSDYGLYLLEGKYDANNNKVDQWKNFDFTTVNAVASEQKILSEEKRGCTSRTVFSVKYTFTQKNGIAMPNAYNRNADTDGSLSDYFLFTTSAAWMPAPGQSCN